MSSTSQDPHGSDAMAGRHGIGDHGDDHGHDDHAHGDGESLGPINVTAWAAGAIGVAAGLIVAVVMAASAGWFG